MSITSGRYSSPWALSVVIRRKRVAQHRGVEGVHAGRDLGDQPLLGVGVLVLDDVGAPCRRRRGPPVRSRSGSAAMLVSSVAAAPSWTATRCRRVCAVSSGASPGSTTTVPARSAGNASRAIRTAWPVPFCSACTTARAAGGDLGQVRGDLVASVADDDDGGPGASAGRQRQARGPSRDRPANPCSTLGRRTDFIRVPSPAARTMTAAGGFASGVLTSVQCLRIRPWESVSTGVGWGTRTRTETARLQRPAGCRLPHPPTRGPQPTEDRRGVSRDPERSHAARHPHGVSYASVTTRVASRICQPRGPRL